MKPFVSRIGPYPLIIMLLLLVVVGFSLYHLPALTIAAAPQLDKEWPAVFAAEFDDPLSARVLLKVRHGDIFTTHTLTLLATLTAAIEALPEVENVESLATVRHVQGGEGFVRVEQLVNRAALGPDTLTRVHEAVFRNNLILGNLVSEDGTVAAINITLARSVLDVQDDGNRAAAIFSNITQLLEEHAGEDHQISLHSRLLSQAQARTVLRRHLGFFLPAAVLIACLIVFLYYRRIGSFLVPLVSIGLSVLTTLGVMAYLHVPVTPVTLAVLPLVLALSCAESVRILSAYLENMTVGGDARDAGVPVVQQNRPPLIAAAGTLCLGIGVFAFSSTPVLRQFAGVGALSVALSAGIALIVPPVLCRYLFRQASGERPLFLIRLSGRIVELYERSRWVTIGLLGLLLIVACVGFFRLRIDAVLPGLSKTSAFADGRPEIAGIATMDVVVDSGQASRIKEPAVLRQIEALQNFIAKQPWCDHVASFADHLKIVQREMQGGDRSMEVIPGSRELVSQYLLVLGGVELGRYVNPPFSAANLVVRHHIASTRALTAAIQAIRTYAAANLSNDLTVHVTGRAVAQSDLTQKLLREQMRYLALALGVIFLILSGIFLSFKMSFAAMLPSLVALGLHFGIMAWLGLSLQPETCMLAVVVFGITVDIILHFLIRYRLHLLETNDQELAVGTTIYREGEPVFLTSVGLFLGFGLFTLSASQSLRTLGLLSALLMVYALINVFFLNPLILKVVPIITIWDFVRFNLKDSLLRESQIFQNLRRSQIKRVILHGSVRQVPANDLAIRQGESGRAMYVLLAGKAEVSIEKAGRKQVLKILEPGELVGEMALLGEPARSANVKALQESKFLQIDEYALKRVQQSAPRLAAVLFWNMASILSERLKNRSGPPSANPAP